LIVALPHRFTGIVAYRIGRVAISWIIQDINVE
jgi:hypothetical protein